MTVGRFSYAHSAAMLIGRYKADELEPLIVEHLLGAQKTIQHLIGKAELAKAAVKKLDDFDENVRAGIAATLSAEQFSELSAVGDFGLMSDKGLQSSPAGRAVVLRRPGAFACLVERFAHRGRG